MIENIYDKKTKSGYQPPLPVAQLTDIVKRDYNFGHDLITRPWTELNDRSVIDDENRGQLMFNAFVDTSIEDPAEAWKWRGTRSMARNKAISMHAQLTAQFLLPLFTAQNENDEVDQEYSEVMRDLIEWMAEPTNSNYQSSFIQVAFGMMTNPVTYLGAEFYEVYQTVKDKNENGEKTTKEMLDEVLSGYQVPIYSSSQVLITNAYERNIQKQRAIIKRRYVDKSELEARYGKHENWQYVQTGCKSIYNEADGLFYDIKDLQHPNLVEEVIYLNRREDSEVPFIGGIYMGDADVDNNPICHRDNRGAPKYNVTPFGYSRIGEHFFYYKSMMNIAGWDNNLYDAMTEMVMNRTMLEVDPPIAISGSDKIDSEIIFPKGVVAFEDEKTKIIPLLPASNLAAGFNALGDTASSMSNETIDPLSSGQMPAGRQNPAVVAAVQAQAQKIIGEVSKQFVMSLALYGDLMKDIAINHITLPEVEELTAGNLRLKYRSFLLPNRTVGGKSVHKKIMFDQSLIGADMSDEEKASAALELLEESNWPDSKQALVRVNPELFAKFKYLSKVDIEELQTKNSQYWQPILTNLYATLRDDPMIEREDLLRRLLRSYFNSEGDAMVKKAPAQMPGQPDPNMDPNAPKPQGYNQQGSMMQNRALSTTLPLSRSHP